MTARTENESEKLPFSTASWTPDGANHWRQAGGSELSVTSSKTSADGKFQSEPLFRDTMLREILGRGGGLVSADLTGQGLSAVGAVIAKFPQKPSGMTYEGWLVFVRDGTDYRVAVRFPEVGTTGVRDTAVMMIWMNGRPDDADPLEGWMLDPYDRTRRDPLMRNVADDDVHDAKFPSHPLTLVRLELRRIQASLAPR